MYDGNSPTARVLAHVLEGLEAYGGKALVAELDARGYDVTTLRFHCWPKSTGGRLPQGAAHRLGAALIDAIDPWFLSPPKAARP